MARNAIGSNEVDANSPLNSVLMGKIKDNDDDHETRIISLEGLGGNLINLVGSGTSAPGSADHVFSLDSTIDWRDRNIAIKGIVAGTDDRTAGTVGTLADMQKILPGGSEDDQVFFSNGSAGFVSGTPAFTSTLNEYDFPDGWFYSQDGGPGYTTPPHLVLNGIVGSTYVQSFTIWVYDADPWSMLMTMHTNFSSPTGYAAWNLQVLYSAKLGGV